MKQEIRLATCDDLPIVEAIVRAAYGHYVARIGREPGPMQDDYRLLIERRQVHAVEADSVVTGIIVLIPENDAMCWTTSPFPQRRKAAVWDAG
jgi:hypothetical protein